MDAVIGTTKIRWAYPKDRQQPVAFRLRVGRSTGSYALDITLSTGFNYPKGIFEVDLQQIVDVNITGTYYVKVSSIHYDGTQVHGDEFTINVIEPTDAVIAPVVYVA